MAHATGIPPSSVSVQIANRMLPTVSDEPDRSPTIAVTTIPTTNSTMSAAPTNASHLIC